MRHDVNKIDFTYNGYSGWSDRTISTVRIHRLPAFPSPSAALLYVTHCAPRLSLFSSLSARAPVSSHLHIMVPCTSLTETW